MARVSLVLPSPFAPWLRTFSGADSQEARSGREKSHGTVRTLARPRRARRERFMAEPGPHRHACRERSGCSTCDGPPCCPKLRVAPVLLLQVGCLDPDWRRKLSRAGLRRIEA